MITTLPMPKNAQQLYIDGPVGLLDCMEFPVVNESISGVAIIFHPDPKGGGNNTNKVVQAIAKSLHKRGYWCICPNLRGVGQSSGTHDMGIGEVDDGMSIVQYVRNKFSNPNLILAGFSFGTSIASNVAAKLDDNYKKLILLGLAVSRYSVVVSNVAKTIAIHGEDDEIIDLDLVRDWSRKYEMPLMVIPNTGHFFHGKLTLLQQIIDGCTM